MPCLMRISAALPLAALSLLLCGVSGNEPIQSLAADGDLELPQLLDSKNVGSKLRIGDVYFVFSYGKFLHRITQAATKNCDLKGKKMPFAHSGVIVKQLPPSGGDGALTTADFMVVQAETSGLQYMPLNRVLQDYSYVAVVRSNVGDADSIATYAVQRMSAGFDFWWAGSVLSVAASMKQRHPMFQLREKTEGGTGTCYNLMQDRIICSQLTMLALQCGKAVDENATSITNPAALCNEMLNNPKMTFGKGSELLVLEDTGHKPVHENHRDVPWNMERKGKWHTELKRRTELTKLSPGDNVYNMQSLNLLELFKLPWVPYYDGFFMLEFKVKCSQCRLSFGLLSINNGSNTHTVNLEFKGDTVEGQSNGQSISSKQAEFADQYKFEAEHSVEMYIVVANSEEEQKKQLTNNAVAFSVAFCVTNQSNPQSYCLFSDASQKTPWFKQVEVPTDAQLLSVFVGSEGAEQLPVEVLNVDSQVVGFQPSKMAGTSQGLVQATNLEDAHLVSHMLKTDHGLGVELRRDVSEHNQTFYRVVQVLDPTNLQPSFAQGDRIMSVNGVSVSQMETDLNTTLEGTIPQQYLKYDQDNHFFVQSAGSHGLSQGKVHIFKGFKVRRDAE